MDYSYAWEKSDIRKIDKLNQLTNPDTFWDNVRKLTRNVMSDHSIKSWQCLAEIRFDELTSTAYMDEDDVVNSSTHSRRRRNIYASRNYLEREFLEAYAWMFDTTKKEAEYAYREASQSYIESIIEAYRKNAENSFYYD